jgi:hypothetical protein
MIIVFIFFKRTMLDGVVSQDAPPEWRTVLWAVIVSIILVFVGILTYSCKSLTNCQIRSVYRLIEFGLGFNGYPFTHEWIFYVLESTPMFIAISLFCFAFPGKFLPSKNVVQFNSGVEGGKRQEH